MTIILPPGVIPSVESSLDGLEVITLPLKTNFSAILESPAHEHTQSYSLILSVHLTAVSSVHHSDELGPGTMQTCSAPSN